VKLEKVALSAALPPEVAHPACCNHETHNAPTYQISAQSGSAWLRCSDSSISLGLFLGAPLSGWI